MRHVFSVRLAAIGLIASLTPVAHAAPPAERLASLPLEQLMQFKVESVSRYRQQVGTAPASVSIVTAQDIRAFGYRTLTDILQSMRGLYISYDRNYAALGVRGFAVPGDYNTRVLMLVDGVRFADPVYDQVPIGTDFPIDVALIERVEFIAGPTSAVYGSNALLGVINIVTKSGGDYRGANLEGGVGSYRDGHARATVGETTTAGGSWLLSATRHSRHGDDLYYPEFDTPAQNNGVAKDADYDRSTSLFAKYQQGGFALTLSHGDRTKGIPTASFDQTFNDDRSQTVDTRTHIGAQYQHRASADLQLIARGYGGHYDYTGNYIYNDSALENRDQTVATWFGGELQAGWSGWARQRLVAGVEYRAAPRLDQENFDVDPFAQRLDDRRDSHVGGVYLQDDIALSETLTLNLGDRLDRQSDGDWVHSPRAGLVYAPAASTALKLLYGSAYRTPNVYEQFYYPAFSREAGAVDVDPSDLDRERVRSLEAIVDHAIDASQRISLSLFENSIDDLISLQSQPDGSLAFANTTQARTRGAELEWQIATAFGARLKTTYTWQQTRDDDEHRLPNSPRHLFKLNLSGPLGGGIDYGVALRALSERQSLRGEVAGYGALDLTLNAALGDRIDVSASVYNAFDQHYADPGSSEHVQRALPQDERTLMLRVNYWL